MIDDPNEFKRPIIPPEMRQQAFPHHFYNMYQPQLLLPNNSAFHRPDGSGAGKPMTVSNSQFFLHPRDNWIAFLFISFQLIRFPVLCPIFQISNSFVKLEFFILALPIYRVSLC